MLSWIFLKFNAERPLNFIYFQIPFELDSYLRQRIFSNYKSFSENSKHLKILIS